MIKTIRASQRHFTDFGWLKTSWSFSFADFYDPENIQFGPLRVFNEDIVTPGMGFPTHSHREMEIVTIMLSGAMTFEDHVGNKHVVKAGEVHHITTGAYVSHSEFNHEKEPAHYYQIWFYPTDKRDDTLYGQKDFSGSVVRNDFLPLVSGQVVPGTVPMSCDATIYSCELNSGRELDYVLRDNRRAFIYLTSGELDINDKRYQTNDQARIDLEKDIHLQALRDTSLILIDLPSSQGFGYDKMTLLGASV
jgi:redox-sensitive bicupin YhaK (pirin superfamily)